MTEKSILEDSDVRWDEREGRPRKIRGEFALPLADTPEDSIKAFLHANADCPRSVPSNGTPVPGLR